VRSAQVVDALAAHNGVSQMDRITVRMLATLTLALLPSSALAETGCPDSLPGTYTLSCDHCGVFTDISGPQGMTPMPHPKCGVLMCWFCSTKAGGKRRTFIDRRKCWNGPFWNDDGFLTCGGQERVLLPLPKEARPIGRVELTCLGHPPHADGEAHQHRED
jgi:hypothetical protein